jgi:hypothetical protein
MLIAGRLQHRCGVFSAQFYEPFTVNADMNDSESIYDLYYILNPAGLRRLMRGRV